MEETPKMRFVRRFLSRDLGMVRIILAGGSLGLTPAGAGVLAGLVGLETRGGMTIVPVAVWQNLLAHLSLQEENEFHTTVQEQSVAVVDSNDLRARFNQVRVRRGLQEGAPLQTRVALDLELARRLSRWSEGEPLPVDLERELASIRNPTAVMTRVKAVELYDKLVENPTAELSDMELVTLGKLLTRGPREEFYSLNLDFLDHHPQEQEARAKVSRLAPPRVGLNIRERILGAAAPAPPATAVPVTTSTMRVLPRSTLIPRQGPPTLVLGGGLPRRDPGGTLLGGRSLVSSPAPHAPIVPPRFYGTRASDRPSAREITQAVREEDEADEVEDPGEGEPEEEETTDVEEVETPAPAPDPGATICCICQLLPWAPMVRFQCAHEVHASCRQGITQCPLCREAITGEETVNPEWDFDNRVSYLQHEGLLGLQGPIDTSQLLRRPTPGEIEHLAVLEGVTPDMIAGIYDQAYQGLREEVEQYLQERA
jgi:hypothetical protein